MLFRSLLSILLMLLTRVLSAQELEGKYCYGIEFTSYGRTEDGFRNIPLILSDEDSTFRYTVCNVLNTHSYKPFTIHTTGKWTLKNDTLICHENETGEQLVFVIIDNREGLSKYVEVFGKCEKIKRNGKIVLSESSDEFIMNLEAVKFHYGNY